IGPAEVVDAAVDGLPAAATSLRVVLNATGVLVHTNLGRAPLSAAAVQALGVAAGATDVEFDLATGERARRGRGALAALAEAVPAGRGGPGGGNKPAPPLPGGPAPAPRPASR